MSNVLDIFEPSVSKVEKGLEGKLILIHSDERKLGKTYQAVRMPKPFYLRFEQGINALNGVKYAPLTSWTDFKKVNKQLTSKGTVDKARELYTTIIVDTVDVAIKYCEAYMCDKHGVDTIGEAKKGFGCWSEYEKEWFAEINKLTNAGYCVYFISHSTPVKKIDVRTNEEYVQYVPKGDKRTIDLVVDLVDVIGFLKSNGLSEDGSEVKSSLYLTNTKEFMAGSRFDYLPSVIEEFTAENLQTAIREAIEKQEEVDGVQGVTFEEKKTLEFKKTWTHEEILNEIKPLYKRLAKDKPEETSEIVEGALGIGVKFIETTKRQVPQLEFILSELQDLDKQ